MVRIPVVAILRIGVSPTEPVGPFLPLVRTPPRSNLLVLLCIESSLDATYPARER